MALHDSLVARISDVVHVDAARRAIIHLARDCTQDETLLGKLTLIVQEMGRNIVTHAHEGDLFYRQDAHSLQIIAIDRGPGMTNIQQCLADNFSTAGTMGAGLGGIRRLADDFDIYSEMDKGTVVFAQLLLQTPAVSALRIGAVSTALAGETLCGDAWSVVGNRIFVADGLGHGHYAHQASSKAREIFLHQNPQSSLDECMEQMHRALISTRGAAVAIAEIDAAQGQVKFCGMGNIAGVLLDDERRNMVSSNGTLGYRISRMRTFSYPWGRETLLIMASDGISLRFNLGDYPGIKLRHPAVIAALIHRDFKRLNDDATVVVIKHE